jgi:hypothetical protein
MMHGKPKMTESFLETSRSGNPKWSLNLGFNFVTGIFLGLLAGLIYLLTLSSSPSADSLLYVMDIESGDPNRLLVPKHILLHPLGLAFYRLWQGLGWKEGAWLPSQVLNAFGGAVSVVLLFSIVLRLTYSRRVAIIAALGLSISGSMWLLSVDAEFVTIPLAASMLVLGGMFTLNSLRDGWYGDSIALAFLTFLAFLTYSNSLFLIIVVGVRYWLIENSSKAVRIRHYLVYLLSLLILMLFVGFILGSNRGNVSQYLNTLDSQFDEYGRWQPSDIAHGAYAFVRSFGLYRGLGMNDRTTLFLSSATTWERLWFIGFYVVMTFAVVLPMMVGLIQRRWLWQEHWRTLIILVVWAGFYTVFAIYWVPGDLTFWVPVTVAWWIFTPLVLGAPFTRPSVVCFSWIGAILFILILFTNNAVSFILPQCDRSQSSILQLSTALKKYTSPEDQLVVNELEVLALQTKYFSDCKFIEVTPWPGNIEESRNEVVKALDSADRQGNRVFIVDACELYCDEWGDFFQSIVPEDQMPVWESMGVRLFELSP